MSLATTCDVKKSLSEAEIRAVFGTPTEADPHLYCETNSTTHLRIYVRLDNYGRRRRTLETVKKLAMLVLAFEELIDKMLADHVGYTSEDVSTSLVLESQVAQPTLCAGYRPLQCQQHRPCGPRSERETPTHLVRQIIHRSHLSHVPR